jgi:hypothetical protein
MLSIANAWLLPAHILYPWPEQRFGVTELGSVCNSSYRMDLFGAALA